MDIKEKDEDLEQESLRKKEGNQMHKYVAQSTSIYTPLAVI